MDNALVSIIVPVYNVEKYLKRCVDSLVQQTYKNIEIILVDDGSTDLSSKICDTYAEKYRFIHVIHQQNAGLSAARNAGTELASGKYICYVDSDDYADTDMVEYLCYLKDKFKSKMAVCGYRLVYESGKKYKIFGSGEEICLDTFNCLKNMLYHKNVEISACAKLYDREIFNSVRYPVGKKFEDVGTTYKTILQCEKIACGFRPKYNYCIRPNSITTQKFNEKNFDFLTLADKMCDDLAELYPDLDKAIARYRLYSRFSTYNRMIDVRNFNEEKEEVIKYIKKYGSKILKDIDSPLRDKVAVILFKLNLSLYNTVWRFIKKS